MKPWPEKPDYVTVPTWMDRGGNVVEEEPYFDETNYERARAEAAIARLRVAVDALKCASTEIKSYLGGEDSHLLYVVRKVDEALDAVGEIPK